MRAEAGVTYVSVDDSSLAPASLTLFDTGSLAPISYSRQKFDAAGAYTVADSTTGTTQSVKLRPTGPATTTVGVPFTE